ncbi:MAG: DUF721 domain-containing protein [candidate division Zixibacteria bacterium]|nr:DUF721 domain-containing protein [candidate division Zixibacteria bacterium]
MRKYKYQPFGKSGHNRYKDTHRLSGVIETVIGSLGLMSKYHGWQVINNWTEIVGQQIAKTATAIRFEDSTLYVAVADDAWRQELVMQTDSILEKIRQYPYGKAVKQLRFVRGEKG